MIGRKALYATLTVCVVGLTGPAVGEQQDSCPSGYAMGGGRCQPIEICPHGQLVDGRCSADTAEDAAPVVGPDVKSAAPKKRPSAPSATGPIPPQPTTNSHPTVTEPPQPPIATPQRCVSRTVFTSAPAKQTTRLFMKFDEREVLLVGGPAGVLFERYIADAKKDDIRLDFQALRVDVVERDGSLKVIQLGSMTFEEILSAATYKEKWRKTLAGIKSFDRGDGEMLASTKNWDIVCGGGSTVAGNN